MQEQKIAQDYIIADSAEYIPFSDDYEEDIFYAEEFQRPTPRSKHSREILIKPMLYS